MGDINGLNLYMYWGNNPIWAIGAIGTQLMAFVGQSWSLSIGGGMKMMGDVLVFVQATTITITGAQVAGGGALALGLAGAIAMFAKGFGARLGHNQYENKMFNDVANKHGLTQEERGILHNEIHGNNLTFKEIEQVIWDLFGK